MGKATDFFGDEAGEQWNATMKALHRFAQLTDCPLGTDVVQWFSQKHDELVRAGRPTPSPKDPQL